MTHNLVAHYVALHNLRDEKALNYLIAHFYEQVAGKVHSMLPDYPYADTIVHDSFMKVWHSGRSFDNPNHYITYVKRTAHNMCVNLAEKWDIEKKHQKEYKRFKFSENPETDSAMHDLYQEVIGNLRQLPDSELKEVMKDAYIEGLDHQELAEKYGKPENHIRSILFRGRARLKELFSKKRKKS